MALAIEVHIDLPITAGAARDGHGTAVVEAEGACPGCQRAEAAVGLSASRCDAQIAPRCQCRGGDALVGRSCGACAVQGDVARGGDGQQLDLACGSDQHVLGRCDAAGTHGTLLTLHPHTTQRRGDFGGAQRVFGDQLGIQTGRNGRIAGCPALVQCHRAGFAGHGQHRCLGFNKAADRTLGKLGVSNGMERGEHHGPVRAGDVQIGLAVTPVQHGATRAGHHNGTRRVVGGFDAGQGDIARGGQDDGAHTAVDGRAVGHADGTALHHGGPRPVAEFGTFCDADFMDTCGQGHALPRAQHTTERKTGHVAVERHATGCGAAVEHAQGTQRRIQVQRTTRSGIAHSPVGRRFDRHGQCGLANVTIRDQFNVGGVYSLGAGAAIVDEAEGGTENRAPTSRDLGDAHGSAVSADEGIAGCRSHQLAALAGEHIHRLTPHTNGPSGAQRDAQTCRIDVASLVAGVGDVAIGHDHHRAGGVERAQPYVVGRHIDATRKRFEQRAAGHGDAASTASGDVDATGSGQVAIHVEIAAVGFEGDVLPRSDAARGHAARGQNVYWASGADVAEHIGVATVSDERHVAARADPLQPDALGGLYIHAARGAQVAVGDHIFLCGVKVDVATGIDVFHGKAGFCTRQVDRVARGRGGVDAAGGAGFDHERIGRRADCAALCDQRGFARLQRAGAVDATRIDHGALRGERDRAGRVHVGHAHVTRLVDPDAFLRARHQGRGAGVAAASKAERDGLVGRADGATGRFQNGLVALDHRGGGIGGIEDGAADLDTDFAIARDLFEVGVATGGVGIGFVGTQIDKTVGGHVELVGQDVEGVLLDHGQLPGVFVQRHVIAFGRHDGELVVDGQTACFAQVDGDRAFVATNLATGAQNHTVAHHIGLFDAGLGVGGRLGEDRLGQWALELGIAPSRERIDLSGARGHQRGVHLADDQCFADLVVRRTIELVQFAQLLLAPIFQRGDLCSGHTRLGQASFLIAGETEHIGVGVVGVRGEGGHRARAGVDGRGLRVAQAPVAAELAAGVGEGALAAHLCTVALQRCRVPQREQFLFGAHVAGFVAVVVDQVTCGFDVDIATTGGDLVDPEVARTLLEGNAARGMGRDAATGGIFGLDVQRGLDAAVQIERTDATARGGDLDAAARDVDRVRVDTHNVFIAQQPDLAGGGDLVDAQGTAQALEGDVAAGGGGGERTVAGDYVDGRAFGTDAGGGVEAQVVAGDGGAATELLDRTLGGLDRHHAAVVGDAPGNPDTRFAFDLDVAAGVTHQLNGDRPVGGHPLGEHVFFPDLGAVVDVVGFLETQGAALLPAAVVDFLLGVGGEGLRAHPEVLRGRAGRGHVNALGHGGGGLGDGVDAVPLDAAQVDRTPEG